MTPLPMGLIQPHEVCAQRDRAATKSSLGAGGAWGWHRGGRSTQQQHCTARSRLHSWICPFIYYLGKHRHGLPKNRFRDLHRLHVPGGLDEPPVVAERTGGGSSCWSSPERVLELHGGFLGPGPMQTPWWGQPNTNPVGWALAFAQFPSGAAQASACAHPTGLGHCVGTGRAPGATSTAPAPRLPPALTPPAHPGLSEAPGDTGSGSDRAHENQAALCPRGRAGAGASQVTEASRLEKTFKINQTSTRPPASPHQTVRLPGSSPSMEHWSCPGMDPRGRAGRARVCRGIRGCAGACMGVHSCMTPGTTQG